ncbi:MAG: hypothetical protein ACYSX0_02330 [Planctomycetota bacterium]|jgi:hypothetical protein
MSGGFAVVLRERHLEGKKVAMVARAVAGITKGQPFDIAHALRHMPGFVVTGVDRETASRVEQAMVPLGIEAAAVPSAALAVFEQIRTIHSGGTEETGFRADLSYREEVSVPWESIRAGSLVRYRQQRAPRAITKSSTAARFLVSAIPSFGFVPPALPGSRAAHEARESLISGSGRIETEETYLFDLFVESPGCTLRIDARGFNYASLGERMQPHCEVNFHSLVTDLVKGARTALFAPPVEHFLNGDKLSGFRVGHLKEFDLYNRWFLLAATGFPPR